MIIHVQPTDPWTDMDFAILEAYQIFQDERCHCGLPRWVCHNEDSDICIRVVEDECEATAAVERVTNADDYKPTPGVRLSPEVYTNSGLPVDARFRESYYQQMKERTDALAADAEAYLDASAFPVD